MVEGIPDAVIADRSFCRQQLQTMSQHLIRRDDAAVWTDLEDRVAFLCLDQDQLFEIDGVGKAVWDFLEEPRSLDEIVEHVRSVYRVDRDRCEADIRSFISRLTENGIVLHGGVASVA